MVLSAIDMKELFFTLLPDKGAPRLFQGETRKNSPVRLVLHGYGDHHPAPRDGQMKGEKGSG